jgi:hypothetical protein
MKRFPLILMISIISTLSAKSQSQYNFTSQWQNTLTLNNNTPFASWSTALEINTPNQNVYGIKFNVNSINRYELSHYGMKLTDIPTVTLNDGWAITMKNKTNSNMGAAFAVSTIGEFSISMTYDDFDNHQKPFKIFSDGTVGINTWSDQDGSLAVTGLSRFDGTIRTTKLEVVDQSIVWADYVFEPEYSLRPIKQLKRYIDSNGHLPNIPTSDDIKETGIDVAKMNVLLLEKVEELSLYIIQLAERIDKLEKNL